MASESMFIGRQPILDVNQDIHAYELLFRSDSGNAAKISDSLSASAEVLINTLGNFGIQKILGNKIGYINIDENFLDHEFFRNIPKDRFILEILETTMISMELLELVEELKQEGYRFALDDFVFKSSQIEYFKPLFDKLSVVKVDVRQNTRQVIESKISLFKNYNIQLLAEKVETLEEFHAYKRAGFHWFQGFYFAKPAILQGSKIDPEKSAILELIDLVQKDQKIEVIEASLKSHPDLTIGLLRYINSAAISARSRITSVRQAVTLMGYKQLMNWLFLLAYATSRRTGYGNPLFYMAIQRAKMMELLLKRYLKNQENQDLLEEGFLTGLLSLLDALMQAPLEDLLKDLNLSQEITDALLGKGNLLGTMLKIVEQSERDRIPEAIALLGKISLSLEDLNFSSTESFAWAQTVGE